MAGRARLPVLREARERADTSAGPSCFGLSSGHVSEILNRRRPLTIDMIGRCRQRKLSRCCYIRHRAACLAALPRPGDGAIERWTQPPPAWEGGGFFVVTTAGTPRAVADDAGNQDSGFASRIDAASAQTPDTS
jgi:hypothetical protein